MYTLYNQFINFVFLPLVLLSYVRINIEQQPGNDCLINIHCNVPAYRFSPSCSLWCGRSARGQFSYLHFYTRVIHQWNAKNTFFFTVTETRFNLSCIKCKEKKTLHWLKFYNLRGKIYCFMGLSLVLRGQLTCVRLLHLCLACNETWKLVEYGISKTIWKQSWLQMITISHCLTGSHPFLYVLLIATSLMWTQTCNSDQMHILLLCLRRVSMADRSGWEPNSSVGN